MGAQQTLTQPNNNEDKDLFGRPQNLKKYDLGHADKDIALNSERVSRRNRPANQVSNSVDGIPKRVPSVQNLHKDRS